MSVAGNIKQFLPGSSRSLHAMHRDVADMHDEVHIEIAEIKRELGELYRRVEQADNGINMNLNYKHGLLASALDAHDTHMKMFAWENYRKDGESLEDAKKRFFRTLPKATGGMRLLQLGCAKLLGEFDALCKANSIDYWMMFGTLLGSVRNEGFIPWDDDVDLGMMRDDVEKLMDIVGDDNRYKITVVYDEYVHCKQVRFRYADESIPCFLDLFYFDWAPTLEDVAASGMRALRNDMIDTMRADADLEFWRTEEHYLSLSDVRSGLVSRHFEGALAKAREDGLICDREHAAGIVWSLDNITDVQKRQTYSLSDVFQTIPMQFEGECLEAPANYDLLLRSPYGDYLELPKDIKSHFEHVSHDELDYGPAHSALDGLVNETAE